MFTSLRVTEYRSIKDSGEVPLGPITVLVGFNNSGKSAFLRVAYLFQEGSNFSGDDVRIIGRRPATVELSFDKPPRQLARSMNRHPDTGDSVPVPKTLGSLFLTGNRGGNLEAQARFPGVEVDVRDLNRFPAMEPHNLILPVLAGRRVGYYREQPNYENSLRVQPQDSSLVSRIQPLIGSQTSEGIRFAKLCRDVLHVSIQVLPGENQQSYLGAQVNLRTSIPLEAMGTGWPCHSEMAPRSPLIRLHHGAGGAG